MNKQVQKNVCFSLPPLQWKSLEQAYKGDSTLPVPTLYFSSCTFDMFPFANLWFFSFLSLCFLMHLADKKTPEMSWAHPALASHPKGQAHMENGSKHEVIFLAKSVAMRAIQNTEGKATSSQVLALPRRDQAKHTQSHITRVEENAHSAAELPEGLSDHLAILQCLLCVSGLLSFPEHQTRLLALHKPAARSPPHCCPNNTNSRWTKT